MPVNYTEVAVMQTPNIPMKMGEPIFIEILTSIKPSGHKGAGRDSESDICTVRDLNNEDPIAKFTWHVPAIAKIRLQEKFPDNKGYIGKTFKVTRWPKANGQKAGAVELVEIKVKG